MAVNLFGVVLILKAIEYERTLQKILGAFYQAKGTYH